MYSTPEPFPQGTDTGNPKVQAARCSGFQPGWGDWIRPRVEQRKFAECPSLMRLHFLSTSTAAQNLVRVCHRDNSHNVALWEDELNSRGQDGFRRTHLETNNCEISDLEGYEELVSDE